MGYCIEDKSYGNGEEYYLVWTSGPYPVCVGIFRTKEEAQGFMKYLEFFDAVKQENRDFEYYRIKKIILNNTNVMINIIDENIKRDIDRTVELFNDMEIFYNIKNSKQKKTSIKLQA